MKLIKKSLTLLLTLSMLLIVIPCNFVFADGEEPEPLPLLSLVKNGDQRGERYDTDPKILKYKYENSDLVRDDNSNVPAIGQDGSIEGIENITYVPGDPLGTFVIKIKEDGEINLSSYYGCLGTGTVAYGGLISSSNSNIKIIGKGKINLTMSSREEQVGFMGSANMIYDFIATEGDIIIGDENSKITLNIKLDVRDNENNKFDTVVIKANTITLDNVNFDIKTRNRVFEVTSEENAQEGDSIEKRSKLLIKNSIIEIENQNLNDADNQERVFKAVVIDKCAGDFTLINSKLGIKCIDTTEEREIIKPESTFIYLSHDDSCFNLIDSKLDAYSNCAASFCQVSHLKIENCSKTDIIQDVPDRLGGWLIDNNNAFINVNSLDITDSNFNFSTKGLLFEVIGYEPEEEEGGMTPTFHSEPILNKDHIIRNYINIEENESRYTGSMSSGAKYIFLRDINRDPLRLRTFGDSRPKVFMYSRMKIKTKRNYLRTSFQGSGFEKNKYLSKDGGYFVFSYDSEEITTQEDADLIMKMLEWNRLKISVDPQKDNPKHEVLNTGIN